MAKRELKNKTAGGAAQSDKKSKRELKVTLALVCHKEGQQLAEVLEDISRQTAFRQIGEILLFQNSACPATKQTAKSLASRLNLKIFSSADNHLGRARAFLVEKAQHELVAFTDPDCRLPITWLEELLSRYLSCKERGQIAALGGPNRLPENKYWKKLVNLSLSAPLGHLYSAQTWRVRKQTKVGHISTTNGLFVKSAVLRAGNFSSRKKRAGEDRELGRRLKNQGLLLLFPAPMVINSYAESYRESLSRLFLFGKGEGQNPIDWKSYFAGLFLPLCGAALALGFIWSPFWLAGMALFSCYLIAGLSLALEHKKIEGLALPFVWILQHSFLSAGVLFGLLRKAYKISFSRIADRH